MGMFEDVLAKTKAVLGQMGEKAGQFVDTSKLNIKLAEMKNDLNAEYENLGKLLYRAKKEGTADEAGMNYSIAQIDSFNIQIEELKKQIAAMKNKVLCSACGQTNETDAVFCSKCGEAIKPSPVDEFKDFD